MTSQPNINDFILCRIGNQVITGQVIEIGTHHGRIVYDLQVIGSPDMRFAYDNQIIAILSPNTVN